MFKLSSKNILISSFFALIVIGLCSCGSTKELKYFQDIPDSTKLASIKLANFTVPVIRPDQVLSINVYTIDLASTQTINTVNTTAVASQTAVLGFDASGYLVDAAGYVELPELGKIKVSDLTIEQAQAAVKQRASKYFNDPIVIIKNKSFKVTFVGEFVKPGAYIIPSEKFTLVDAIGLCGGLTDYGQRDDVLLFRQNDSTKTLSTIRLNLKSSAVLKSPYYYLQNNDVLLANPSRSKGITTDQTFNRYLALYSLMGSILTTIILLFKL
ncbi:polysaccharide biosynthesis/export family protein [Mucilaginibacter sp. AW1-3]